MTELIIVTLVMFILALPLGILWGLVFTEHSEIGVGVWLSYTAAIMMLNELWGLGWDWIFFIWLVFTVSFIIFGLKVMGHE